MVWRDPLRSKFAVPVRAAVPRVRQNVPINFLNRCNPPTPRMFARAHSAHKEVIQAAPRIGNNAGAHEQGRS
jgi:hypothetical protein